MGTERGKTGFRGKSVAVVGLGKSNQALCRYLAKEGARITCFDRKTEEELGDVYSSLSSLGVKWSLGEDYLKPLPGFSLIFVTPGMKKSFPEFLRARANGAVISGEIALFLERCKARVAAVTGSAGKTTTATLAGMMLRESDLGVPVYVGGNIGSVLIEEVDDIPPDALVVLELSSFQLETVTRSPEVALLLNVKPNHLDIHGSYQEYVSAKANILKFQRPDDWCVVNFDDAVASELGEKARGNLCGYTLGGRESQARRAAAWLEGDALKLQLPGLPGPGGGRGYWDDPVVIARRDDFLVPGLHNVSNALGAALLAALMGGTPEGIRSAIRSFRGVPHRIEFVREVSGVRYYNDSIATSPDRTEALLQAISGPLVLILGGYDKGIPFDGLARRILGRECKVVTLGATAPLIEKALYEEWERAARDNPGLKPTEVTRAKSLEEAVSIASRLAGPGWSVALSPACASYDMFSNFEERGRLFKEIVEAL